MNDMGLLRNYSHALRAVKNYNDWPSQQLITSSKSTTEIENVMKHVQS